MIQRNPDSIKYLDRWEKKFGFEGDLNIVKCAELVKDIERAGHKNKMNGLTQAQTWLTQAHKRKSGKEKKEQQKEVGTNR